MANTGKDKAPGPAKIKRGVKTGNIDINSALFLGRRVEQLSLLIEEQVVPVFKELGIIVPVRSCSLLTALADLEVASAADLAKYLGQSHQLVLQKIPALTRLNLLRRQVDPADKRRKVFRLTTAGMNQIQRIGQYSAFFESAYEELNAELGIDLFQIISRAIATLEERGLLERFRTIG